MKKIFFILVTCITVNAQFNYKSVDGWRFKNENSPNYILMSMDDVPAKDIEYYYSFENDYLSIQTVYYQGEESPTEYDEYNFFYEDIVIDASSEQYIILNTERDNDKDLSKYATNQVPYKCFFYTKEKTALMWCRSAKGIILDKFVNEGEMPFNTKEEAKNFVNTLITQCKKVQNDPNFVTDRSILNSFTEKFIDNTAIEAKKNAETVKFINTNYDVAYTIESNKVYAGNKDRLILTNVDNFFGHKYLLDSYLQGISFNSCSYCKVYSLTKSVDSDELIVYNDNSSICAEIIIKGENTVLYEGSYSYVYHYNNPDAKEVCYIDRSLDKTIVYRGSNREKLYEVEGNMHPSIVLYIVALLKMAGEI